MCNLRNKTNEQRKTRDKPRNRLLTADNKFPVTREEVGGGEVGDTGDGGIGECTCPGEHRVMYRSVELLYCTPETSIMLCVN